MRGERRPPCGAAAQVGAHHPPAAAADAHDARAAIIRAGTAA